MSKTNENGVRGTARSYNSGDTVAKTTMAMNAAKAKVFRDIYQKYRATILLNTNLFIADTGSLLISSYFAQVYFSLSNGNFLLDSIFTAIIEYAC